MHFKAENLRIPKHPQLLILAKFIGAMAPQNKGAFFLGHPVHLTATRVRSWKYKS